MALTGKNLPLSILIAFATFGVSYPQYAGGLSAGLGNLCSSLMGVLPIVSMVGVVGGGLIYAGGQLMGAETRARANVWATSLLVGSVISIMITAVAPPILTALYGSTVSCTASSSPPPPQTCNPACIAAGTHCCYPICVPLSQTCVASASATSTK